MLILKEKWMFFQKKLCTHLSPFKKKTQAGSLFQEYLTAHYDAPRFPHMFPTASNFKDLLVLKDLVTEIRTICRWFI